MNRRSSIATLVAVSLLVIVSSPASGQSSGADAPGTAPAIAPKPNVVTETEPVAVPEPSAKAMEYYRGGNWLWVLNQFWAILLPGALAFSGASAWLRSLARRLGRSWFLTIGFYTVMYLTIVFLIELPLAFLEGFVRQHAYGLSNQSLARWLGNSFKNLGVDLVVGFALTWVPYLLLARSPRRWWLYTAILTVPFLFAAVLVKPIWIDPLFNKFGPMHDKALERSILSLAERAGIEGSRVFEVDKSADTKAVNAYVTGVFNTKRIVLWDTLIAKLDEPELLVVMAHEMGHYVLGHVVRSILLSSIVTLAGLFLVDRLGRKLIARFPDRLGFDRLSDVASMPLLLMLIRGGRSGAQPWRTGLQPLPGARGRSIRTRSDPCKPLRRHGIRQAPGGEPQQPQAGITLHALPVYPPEHRRPDRLLQLISSLACRRRSGTREYSEKRARPPNCGK